MADHRYLDNAPFWIVFDKSDLRLQRRKLSRPVEQLLQQRAAAMKSYGLRSDSWQKWSAKGNALSIHAAVLDRVRTARIQREGNLLFLETAIESDDYLSLDLGPAVTLRFAQTLEAVLRAANANTGEGFPSDLGRTRRELDWLAGGGMNPGAGIVGAVRVVGGEKPISVTEFWTVIAESFAGGNATLQLSEVSPEAFSLRARMLADALDTPAHRAAAELSLGDLSSDVWEDVRGWVLSQGLDAYKRAVQEPGELSRRLHELPNQDDLAIGELILFGADEA